MTGPDTGQGGPEFRYAARTLSTTYDTRHEAVGDLARYGDWAGDSVVPITENCLVRQLGTIFVGPDHLGDKYFDDRQHIATTHGVAQIDQVSLIRQVNGSKQEAVNSWWEIECPVCGFSHEVEGASEDARREAIDVMFDCCDVEWQPPSDWIEDCGICGDSHRERHECTRLSMRDPFPSPDSHHYDCAECEWSGDGDDLDGPDGLCPNCGTASVRAMELVTDGGQPRDPEDGQSERTFLLNCRNCTWWTVMDADAYLHVDYERECHEESMRNALAWGPYCPKRSVAIATLPDTAEVPT